MIIMNDEVKLFQWYEDISYFLSQCYYYFIDPKSGQKYCIYLRIRIQDYWSCDLVGCDDDWDIDWKIPVPQFLLSEKFIEDDYPALEIAAQKAAARLFPHISELNVLKQNLQHNFEIHSLKHNAYTFPDTLKTLGKNCPYEIFFKGVSGWIASGHRVAIIGARVATAKECEIARQLGRLHSSELVVSGLARGIDTAAHRGCVEAGGISVAVVATGLDKVYPRDNVGLELAILQNGGTIVSEYPKGTKATPTRLIARTRIQMAIADKVIVVACEKESGTMHAIEWAIKLDKPIFAIDNDRSGNRYLIDNKIAQPLKYPFQLPHCDS